MTEDVKSERDGAVLRLTLCRAERMNALDVPTLTALAHALQHAGEDDAVRVVVITGQGRAFCTGADLTALSEPPEVIMAAANGLIRAVVNAPVPVIAAVNGPAAGFGVGLACAADLTYAAESAYFMLAFCNIGLMPDGGTTALVSASIGRARATEMAMLARRMPAEEAGRAGLVAAVLPDAELQPHVDAIATRLAQGPRQALRVMKHALNASALAVLDDALERERSGQIGLLAGEDVVEGIKAFHEKRKPRFK